MCVNSISDSEYGNVYCVVMNSFSFNLFNAALALEALIDGPHIRSISIHIISYGRISKRNESP